MTLDTIEPIATSFQVDVPNTYESPSSLLVKGFSEGDLLSTPNLLPSSL